MSRNLRDGPYPLKTWHAVEPIPPDKECSNCTHLRREHFPACLHTMKETTNRWGGGTTWLCGCAGGPLFFQ